MSNLITGSIAVLMSIAFLGYYAIRLESIVLWIIIAGNVACLLVDFVQSVKKGNNQTSG
jgi:hypothetical protein